MDEPESEAKVIIETVTEATPELVDYKGRQVVKGWPQKIAAAQLQREIRVNGKICQRVKMGDEISFSGKPADWGPYCHDCSADRGQFHVIGCDVERCPGCRGQMIGCECVIEEPTSALPDMKDFVRDAGRLS